MYTTPTPRSLSELVSQRLTTGCDVIDHVLRGGVSCGAITELVGEASAGKSQFCLQLLHTVQLPCSHRGLEGSALYIYTEGQPALRRLRHVSAAFQARHAQVLPPGHDCLQHITIEKGVSTAADLLSTVAHIPALINQPGRRMPLRLVIIDSIANVFRDASDGQEADGAGQPSGHYVQRTSCLFQIAAQLKRFADQYCLAVVVINQGSDNVQVSDDVSGSAVVARGRTTAGMELVSSGRTVQPALGLAWANCVNHRIFLSRVRSAESAAAGDGAQRYLQVVFSPYLPQQGCYYAITADGVEGHQDVADAREVFMQAG